MAIALLSFWPLPHTVAAELAVGLFYTDLGEGVFRYDVSIENSGLEAIAIVSLTEAPLNDPFIGSTLATPAGFLGSYDSNLGIIDFLEGTSLFAPGTTTDGFSFESTASPFDNFFQNFEAFTINGGMMAGNIQVVPEPSGALLLVLGLALWLQRRKQTRTPHS